MDKVYNFMNTKLDINGDAIFRGLDLALLPLLIGFYYLTYRVLIKNLIK